MRCPSHTKDDKGRDRRCDLAEGHSGDHLSRGRVSKKIGALLWCFIKRKEDAVDHIKIPAGPSREELQVAVQAMGHDMGFKRDMVPFWAKDLIIDLYGKGWRHKAVERACHYAEKTGLSASDILDAWERGRDYWYMNFYQDGNQKGLDERDQKERWAEAMVRDLNGLHPGTICPTSTWVLNLGIRLVQSGWSKE